MLQYFQNKFFKKKNSLHWLFFFILVLFLTYQWAMLMLISLPSSSSITSRQKKTPLLHLLLGCCLSSPSVTQCHFVCGKNGCGFHRTPRAICWVTSWENFSCCSPSHVENGGNDMENYPLGKNVSTEEGKNKERTKLSNFINTAHS